LVPILDRLGPLILDSAAAVALWMAFVGLGMASAGSPERRRLVARLGIVGILVLIPASWLTPNRLEPLRTGFNLLHWQLPTAPEPVSVAIESATRGITLLYLLGVAAGLSWLFFSGLAGWLIRERSERARVSTLELYQALRPPCGRLNRLPRLRVSRLVRQPVLLGWFRPTILVPHDWLETGSEDRLKLALLHELAHAEHGDPAFNFWSGLAKAFAFCLPGLGWLVRRAKLDQEILADRRAAAAFGGNTAYASTLVGAAAMPALSGLLQRSAVASGVWTPLRERLTVLLEAGKSTTSAPTTVAWTHAVRASAVLGVGLLAPISVRLPEPTLPEVAVVRAPESLMVASIAVPSTEPGDAPFELPIALGDAFELDLELWSNAESIANTRLAGIRVAPDLRLVESPAWHRIVISRDHSKLQATVDGQSARAMSEASSDWLAIEAAPGTVARIRNLRIIY
jgi:bla regulator protein blaR1